MNSPAFIFDTSPLITLAGIIVDGKAAINHILPLIHILIVETVAQEATANPTYTDARIIQTLLDAKQISRVPVPTTPLDDLISAYPKLGTDKGKGERDTIRLGIVTRDVRVIIDDQQAFFVAARFELNPLTLFDLIVELTRSRKLTKELALKITTATSGRYAPIAIEHTVYKLREVSDDPDHD
jgi:hypothetical protein